MKPRFPLDHTQRTDGAQGVWEGSGIAKSDDCLDHRISPAENNWTIGLLLLTRASGDEGFHCDCFACCIAACAARSRATGDDTVGCTGSGTAFAIGERERTRSLMLLAALAVLRL